MSAGTHYASQLGDDRLQSSRWAFHEESASVGQNQNAFAVVAPASSSSACRNIFVVHRLTTVRIVG